MFHVLDGSALEGGGQILRNSIAYSALLRKNIKINAIRAGRSPPGLRMQHLKGIQVVAELCNGHLEGAEKSSTCLSFIPNELQPCRSDLVVNIQTAGSITLLIQTILPVLLFQRRRSERTSPASSKPSVVILFGGTNATNAPQIDYFLHVFLPVAERIFGVGRVCATVVRRGYYPKGEGEVRLEVDPLASGESLKAIDLVERGAVTRIRGYIFVGGVLPLSMAWDMHKQAVHDLEVAPGLGTNRLPGLKRDLRVVSEPTAKGGGSGLVLWATTESGSLIAGSSLGDRTKRAKFVASEATAMLLKNLESDACVDEFLQDQLIIFMALASGHSRILTGPLTLHTRTAMWIASELTGVEFSTQELEDGQRVLIECDGIGFTYH